MFLPNCKISLSGLMVPNCSQKSIESIMQALQNRSPSDSFLSLSVVNAEGGARGSLSITSSAMKFESSQEGLDPLNVVKKLSKDLQKQLKQWIHQRSF